VVRGIGTDVVEIDRIGNLIEKYGDHFLNKVFTDNEIAYCRSKARPAVHFAGRWAVKEAFYKALPATVQPVSGWKSIETLPDGTTGKPVICLLAELLKERLTSEAISSWMVTVSHERAVCVAVVILQ
jgi:holo-[acyl-carrier protein] synthase